MNGIKTKEKEVPKEKFVIKVDSMSVCHPPVSLSHEIYSESTGAIATKFCENMWSATATRATNDIISC